MNSPQAPDPYATAAAQTTSNQQTAQYQQNLNDVNQITPYGSLMYSQTGTNPDGSPQTTADLSLSPQMQALVGSNISNATGNSSIEGALQNTVGSTISAGLPQLQNLNLSPGALDAQLNQANQATLDPLWNRYQGQTQQQLYDQGLAPGSEGYSNGMTDFNNSRNQAYDQMFVADQGQAANDLTAMNNSYNTNAMAAYNEPLNALSALQSGSQVSQPGVGQISTPQTSVAGTNVSGLVEQNYQDQLSQNNATMGGLFGLGGTLGGGLLGAAGKAGSFGSLFGL